MIDGTALAGLAHRAGLDGASLVIERLDGPDDGLFVVVDPWRPLYPASMIKLPIAFALAMQRTAGRCSLTDLAQVDASNMTPNDAPSPFAPGRPAPLGALADAMLARSDNVATNVLIDVLGREVISELCAAAGLAATVVRRKLSGALPLIDDPQATGRNTHPAGDHARLLRRLARERSDDAWIYDMLAAQIWNDKLAAGLEPGDRFAHKTGDTDEVSHDGGILTLASGARYILVVYTALRACPQTDARFAAFMRSLRPFLEPGP